MDLEQDMRRLQERLWTEQLYREYDNIIYHYRLKLRKPSLQVTENDSYWGQWNPMLRRISLNRQLIRQHNWDVVVEVLKHEMAHQLVHEFFMQPDSNHGDWFHKACDLLAVAPWARKATGNLASSIGRQQPPLSAKQEALLKRVEKLLALGRSDNQHEAYLAMQEASRLSQRHSLDQLLLEDDDFDYVIISHQLKIIPQHQTFIASILNSHFQVDTIFCDQYDAKKQERFKALEIMGKRDNIKLAEYAYHYLWNQLPILWDAERRLKSHTRKSRKSFYLGILTGFNEKLQRDAGAQRVQQGEGRHETTALVERQQEQLIHYAKKRHPRVHRRSYQCQLKDNDAFQEGKKQGRLMSLRRGLKQHGSPLLGAGPQR